MEIIFHAHNADITPAQQARAEQGLRKIERRLGRATAAVVRFAEDGRMRRVEIALEVARGRRFVAEGQARFFGTAVNHALDHLTAQLAHLKRARKPRPRRVATA